MLADGDMALSLAPHLAESHASKGVALYAAGRSQDAFAAFAKALDLDPDLAGFHFLHGLIARDVGDLKTAATAFSLAASERPDDAAACSLLADVYRAEGRDAESHAAARRCLIRVQAILDRGAGSADILAIGAASAAELDDDVRAEEWARLAIELEPGNFTARYNVVCAYAVMGRTEIALEHLEHIYSNVPRARQWLSRIIRVDPQLGTLRNRRDFQNLEDRLAADAQTSGQAR